MKNLLGYLPLHFLCFLILGICFQWLFDGWNFDSKVFFSIFFLLCLVGVFFKKSSIFKVITWLAFFLTGIFLVYKGDNRNNQNYYQNYLTDSTTVILEVDQVLKTGIHYHQYFANVIQVDQQNTSGNILLHVQKDSLFDAYKIGDQLALANRMIPITKPSNPHQFDYQHYLSKKSIYQQVFVKNQQIIFLKSTAKQWINIIDDIRINIQNSLKDQHFSEDEFAVINALLLGQRQDISKELIDETFQYVWDTPNWWTDEKRGYSLHWWVSRFTEESNIFNASGRFGQYIFVDPKNDIVFVRITKYKPSEGSVQKWGNLSWLSALNNVEFLIWFYQKLEKWGFISIEAKEGREVTVITPNTDRDGASKEFYENYSLVLDAIDGLSS